jgi:hypothetical protein
MKVIEFVNYMKKNTNRTMKEDQVASLANKALEPKAYLGFDKKRELVDEIISKSIYYNNGVFKFNGVERYMYFTMYTIEAYTNLEISDDVVADFDILSESKLLPIVICLIQKEFDDVNVFLQMQCEYILEDNSVEAQVGKFFNNILEKLDNIGNGLSKSLSNINVNELLQHKDEIFEMLNRIK